MENHSFLMKTKPELANFMWAQTNTALNKLSQNSFSGKPWDKEQSIRFRE